MPKSSSSDKSNDPKLPDSSGLLKMSDLGNKPPSYKSMPKDGKTRRLYDNEPIMGHGSAFSSSMFNTDSERKDFADRRREGLKRGLVSSAGKALRGKKDLSHEDRELMSSGKNTVDPEKRARLAQLRRTTGFRGAVNNMRRQVYQEALRFGSDKAFYWLLGLILPTFGLAIIGLDILWLLGSRLGGGLKAWQKITIALLNLAVLGLLFILFLGSMVYFCNVTIPFGTTIAKGLGYIGAPEYVTFCKYFDIANISAGISGGSTSGSSSNGGSRITGGKANTYTGIPSNHTLPEIEQTGGCAIALLNGRPKDKELAQINEQLFVHIKSLCAKAAQEGKRLTISAFTGCNGTSICSGHDSLSLHYRGCAVDFGDNPSSVNGRFIIANSSQFTVNPGADAHQDNHTHLDLGARCVEASGSGAPNLRG